MKHTEVQRKPETSCIYSMPQAEDSIITAELINKWHKAL
jgi:hypothetical protein